MFAYCNNNPVILSDASGTAPSLSAFFTGVAAICLGVAAVASVAPLICCAVSGTALVGLASSAAVVAAAAQEAAMIAATCAVVTNKAEQLTKSYTVYTLSDRETNQVMYVGRTCDYDTRMRAHALNPSRKDLVPSVKHENLSYLQARALEHAYIVYYSTLDKSNKSMNQINGVNPSRNDFKDIMGNGFGFDEAIDSLLTNDLLVAMGM